MSTRSSSHLSLHVRLTLHGTDISQLAGVQTSMMYHHHGLQMAFTGNYDEYFGMSTDADAVVYLMLMNNMVHDMFPHAITIGEDVSGMPTFCRCAHPPCSNPPFALLGNLSMLCTCRPAHCRTSTTLCTLLAANVVPSHQAAASAPLAMEKVAPL